MSIRTDHSFHIGEQHLKNGKPAQDYALSGMLSPEIAYAVVADGCSSGGMTDIGARLFALATERAIKEHMRPGGPFVHIGFIRDMYAETYRSTMGLEHRDMLATNLYAVAMDGKIYTNVTGDGVVALQYENDLVVRRYTWAKNMPYYPAYKHAGQDKSFAEAQGLSNSVFEMTSLLLQGDTSEREGEYIDNINITTAMSGVGDVNGDLQRRGKLRAVGLFSDGVEQVDGWEMPAVVRALMSFKSTKGQFVTRRMNRFLQDAKKSDRGPIDDIAMAVIVLENETPT